MNIRSHPHWPALEKIYHVLISHGYKAYLAGGCVRDSLLGKSANDLDLATDATPETLEGLFPKTVAVGKAFGVMLVIEEGISFEVATFRSDGTYEDGRRPDSVVYTTPEEDARRRDFTVNALFYDLDQGRVLDFVGGVEDLADKKLKAVGVPEERFREDHLRLLRAVRFSAQLGFEIETETYTAVKALSDLVKTVSAERVHEETLKLLRSTHVKKGLELLQSTGLGKNLFPGWSEVYQNHQKEFELFFASPSNDDGILWMRFLSPWVLAKSLQWQGILDQYRFPRLLNKNLKRGLERLETPKQFFALSRGQQLAALADEGLRLFLGICASLPGSEKIPAENLLQQWQKWNQKMPEALVNGEDLKSRFQGKDLGVWLHQLYVWQLEGLYSSKAELLAQVK